MPAESSCKRELDITIPWEHVEGEIEKVVTAFRRDARIPGFRKGKVPPMVVRQRFWKDIQQEVLERVVPDAFWKEAESRKLQVVGSPDVKDLHFHEGNPLTFHADFEIVPEFELGDYRRLEVPFTEPEVSDEDIDKEIQALREQHVSFKNLDPQPLADGHVAVLSMQSPDVPELDREETTLAIGEEGTLPEFSENLRGKSPGDEVDFEVKYPADFANEKLAGKTVSFHAKVIGLREKELPEADDAFASEVGDFKTLDELRGRIREAIQAQRRNHAVEAAKDKLVDALIEKHDFPAPEKLVDRQIASRAERRLRAFAAQGIDTSKLELSWEKIREAELEGATRDVRAGLLLERIAQVESISASDEELNEQVRASAARSKQTAEAVRRKLAEDGTLDRMRSHIRNEKTLNFLFDEAVKVDQEVSAE